MDLVTRDHRLPYRLVVIAIADDSSWEQADEFPYFVRIIVDDRERPEGETFGAYEVQNFADTHFRRDGDRILYETVDMILDASDFFELLLERHVVVDHPKPSAEGHSNGHLGLSDGVHVR